MNQETQPKWYNSGFYDYIGKGIMYSLIVGTVIGGCSIAARKLTYDGIMEVGKMRYARDAEIEKRKLETLDKLLETYGNKMTPEEFSKFSKTIIEEVTKHDIQFPKETPK